MIQSFFSVLLASFVMSFAAVPARRQHALQLYGYLYSLKYSFVDAPRSG